VRVTIGSAAINSNERTSDTDRAGNEAAEGESQADDHSHDTNPADSRLFPDVTKAPADFRLFSDASLAHGLSIIQQWFGTIGSPAFPSKLVTSMDLTCIGEFIETKKTECLSNKNADMNYNQTILDLLDKYFDALTSARDKGTCGGDEQDCDEMATAASVSQAENDTRDISIEDGAEQKRVKRTTSHTSSTQAGKRMRLRCPPSTLLALIQTDVVSHILGFCWLADEKRFQNVRNQLLQSPSSALVGTVDSREQSSSSGSQVTAVSSGVAHKSVARNTGNTAAASSHDSSLPQNPFKRKRNQLYDESQKGPSGKAATFQGSQALNSKRNGPQQKRAQTRLPPAGPYVPFTVSSKKLDASGKPVYTSETTSWGSWMSCFDR
jgi:hypothetical protein